MQDVFNDEARALRLYFDHIARSKPLSREREVVLAARIKKGDLQARDELVQANLRFVINVAKHYRNRGLPFCEVISAGNLGLITAAERFDGTKGFKFISYAVWWIRQSILQTIAEHTRTVRLPLNQLSLLKDVSEVSRRLGQDRGGKPDVEEIAVELQVSAEQVRDALLSPRTVRLLGETVDEEDEGRLLDTLADIQQDAPDTELLRDSTKEQLKRVLNSLDEREMRIICLYFGLDGYEALTLEKIGGLMPLTRERVRGRPSRFICPKQRSWKHGLCCRKSRSPGETER